MVKEQIGLVTNAVTVVLPEVKSGTKAVEASVGFENEPPEEDQIMFVPIPPIIALKFISSPLQTMISDIGSMVGAGLTIMSRLMGKAHSSESGVKVYVVVLVLLGAGDQVPFTPLRLVEGKTMGSPTQICERTSNSGVTILSTVRLTA